VTTTSLTERGRGEEKRSRVPRMLSLMAPVLALASGCQLFGQDPARCDQSVATVRQAIGFKDFASARTWREYTWKVCDERGVVATLDKEIVDAEAAVAAEADAAKKNAVKLAKDRINAAQKLWRAFDAETPTNRNEQALDAARKSATRLENGLTPTFAQQLRKYNEGEYQKRLAALKR
jgi:phytoene dehydrogenase-like protein